MAAYRQHAGAVQDEWGGGVELYGDGGGGYGDGGYGAVPMGMGGTDRQLAAAHGVGGGMGDYAASHQEHAQHQYNFGIAQTHGGAHASAMAMSPQVLQRQGQIMQTADGRLLELKDAAGAAMDAHKAVLATKMQDKILEQQKEIGRLARLAEGDATEDRGQRVRKHRRHKGKKTFLEGWLKKRGPNYGQPWQARWCVLKKGIFRYFDENPKNGGRLKGDFAISEDVVVNLLTDAGASTEGRYMAARHRNGFEIADRDNSMAGRCFFFDAVSRAKLQAWVTAIEDTIEYRQQHS